jgi:hypothetical protein
MRGSIIVSSDLSACRGKDSISCWASPTDDSVAIYVKAESDPAKTTQNIRHALVRSFGYLTAQLILKVNQTEQGTVLTDTPELRAFKSDLVMSLLDDVVKSPKYALKAFKGSLSGKLLDERSKASERRVAWDRIASSVEGQAFADTVLAESFDSYYCSQASRLVMKNDFSGAYAHMVDYAGTLEKLFSGQLDAEIAATHGEADSLSLWFPGRGIIRGAAAIGRGWGNWRASGRGFFNFRRAQQGGGFIFNRGGLFSRWD